MPEQTLRNVGIWIQGESFAGVSNSVSLEASADTPESTTFADSFRTRAAGGLKTSVLSLEGYFDTIGPDDQQFASLGTERSVMIAPAGQDPGDLAYVVPVAISGHSLAGSIGELLAFTYASEGVGQPFQGRVMDVRSGIDAAVNQELQDFGAIPTGHAQRIWLHVKVKTAGTLRVALRSSSAMTGATVHQRDITGDITQTGLYELTIQTGALHPITDRFWGLGYSITTVDGEFDVAAASMYGEAHIVIPTTPITPPMPGTVSLRGGLGPDLTPAGSDLTIDGVNHVLSFPAFTARHIYIARLASEADITSVVLGSDPTMQNQIGGFTKFASTVTVSGEDYNVWISTQVLTFAAPDTIEAT